ncbi:MAG: serine hydrolase [Flavobacteriales bacterium]
MRILRKFILWLGAILIVIIGLLYATGNGHVISGVRFTYLIGRAGPEVDDRDFFPYTTISATTPQPWPVHGSNGRVSLAPADEQKLKDLFSVGFVVIKNDSLLYENYWSGWNKDSVSNSFSVAKSYVSLLAGITMQEGKLDNVFRKVGEFLPEFDNDPCKKDINLREVLTMSTGLDWSESGANPFSDNARGYYGDHVRDLSLGQPCRDTPGTKFDYISGGTQIMAEVLESIHGQPLDRLVEEKIWKPLGAEHAAYWGKDREDGDFKAFCCLYATARDFARIGQLYLDSGMWHGTRILPVEFWQASITPADLQDGTGPNKRYGYFWWLAELDGKPIYYCRGFHGQYVVVIPHERTVLVRTGMKREEVNKFGHPTDVFEWIRIARNITAQAG